MLRPLRDTWIEVVGSVFRPTRPALVQCRRDGADHLASQREAAEQRRQAIGACERSIEAQRRAVFAAGDGVVASRMTELEREWRRLSRRDPEAGLMDLWARIAPPRWIDRKRWRQAPSDTWLDVALLLASDPAGVEAAENDVASLREALASFGVAVGPRVHWRLATARPAIMTEVLAMPLREARATLATHRSASAVFERALRLELAVADAARGLLPSQPHLADDLAHAAFVDALLSATRLPQRSSPVPALQALWRTGYGLASLDANGVVLELPPGASDAAGASVASDATGTPPAR